MYCGMCLDARALNSAHTELKNGQLATNMLKYFISKSVCESWGGGVFIFGVLKDWLIYGLLQKYLGITLFYEGSP